MNDPIADMLTRIRNAQARDLPQVSMPSSKLKVAIAQVLREEGYIESYQAHQPEDEHATLTVVLKYYRGKPVISKLKRFSRPGLRQYRGTNKFPRVMGGMGTVIVSTSKGVMTGKKARQLNCGGEMICLVE